MARYVRQSQVAPVTGAGRLDYALVAVLLSLSALLLRPLPMSVKTDSKRLREAFQHKFGQSEMRRSVLFGSEGGCWQRGQTRESRPMLSEWVN